MKIGIVGATGRVGTILTAMINADANLMFSGGISRKNNVTDLENIAKNSDVFIDFSAPDISIIAMEVACYAGIPVVTGTTGLSDNDFKKLDALSKNIPILRSDNFSIGIQIMILLLKKCNYFFKNDNLDKFDVSIIEKHHRKKKDSPSGTALLLAKQIDSDVSISSIRGGNIFSDHICDFIGEDEMLTISHRAFSREVFAKGALKCAQWIVGKKPGKYSMLDYIGVNNDYN